MGAQSPASMVLQVVAATLATVCVGMLWYTPLLFGHLWWSIQFPGRKFGDGMRSSGLLPFLSATSYLLQNTAIVVLLNWTLPLAAEGTYLVPTLVGSAMVTLVSSASLPHYLYGGQSLRLYAIHCGHDAVQLVAAIVVAYALA